MVYHGKGGFIYSEVYDMPIWLRQYNITKIQEAIKRENEANQGKESNDTKMERMPDEVKQMIINKSKIPIKNSK